MKTTYIKSNEFLILKWWSFWVLAHNVPWCVPSAEWRVGGLGEHDPRALLGSGGRRGWGEHPRLVERWKKQLKTSEGARPREEMKNGFVGKPPIWSVQKDIYKNLISGGESPQQGEMVSSRCKHSLHSRLKNFILLWKTQWTFLQ